MTQAEWWASAADPWAMLAFAERRASLRKFRLIGVACLRRVGHPSDDARVAALEVEAEQAEYHAEAEADLRITPEYAAAQRDSSAAEATRGPGHRDPRRGNREDRGRNDPVGGGTVADWAAAVAETAVVAQAELLDLARDEPGDPIRRPGQICPIADSEPVEARRAYLRIDASAQAARRAERLAQRDLLLDIFGDLIGPTGPDGSWPPAGPAAPAAEWWCRLPTPIAARVEAERLGAGDGAARRLARRVRDAEAFGRLPELADLLEGAGCADPAILDHLRGPGPHVRGCWVLDRLLGFGPKPAESAPWESP